MGCYSNNDPKKSIKSLDELLDIMPKNDVIVFNIIKAWNIINNKGHENIVCSISGGSDSDIVMDICCKCDINRKIKYVFIDTGLEYNATKEHIKCLEEIYNVDITTFKSHEIGKSIPTSCIEYGQPFLSKQVSDYIYRLQKHNFQWEDDTYDNLVSKYPNCKSALAWWCCNKGDVSRFNITQNKLLKEFILDNKPNFNISNKCCEYSKKKVIHDICKKYDTDLLINGVRKSEGGVRAGVYKNCYSYSSDGVSSYRPIFFYNNQTKMCYEEHFGIKHSKCYTEYGLKRTGCVGCPFGRNLEHELDVLKEYEPKLYRAVHNLFRDSYEYRIKYKEFVSINNGADEKDNQISIFDYMKGE